MSVDDSKLLPCPFCGAKAFLNDYWYKGDPYWGDYVVECTNDVTCGASISGWGGEMKTAIEAWNRRQT